MFQQPFQQTTLIFVFNGSFFHGINGSFFPGSHKGVSNQDRANSQARCERGPGGRARVTIFARTESEVKQRPLIVLSLRRGEWRGVLAPALLSPRGSSWASRRTQAPLPAPLNHAPAARAVPPRHEISGEAGRDLQTDEFCGYLARASGGGSTEMPLASAHRGTSPFAFEGRAQARPCLPGTVSKGTRWSLRPFEPHARSATIDGPL